MSAAAFQIQDAAIFASHRDVHLQTEMSQKQDADAAAAATELTHAHTQLQAACHARAKMPHPCLFLLLA